MSTLKITGNKLILDNKETLREDLFSKNFLEYSDKRADDFYVDHYCVNEMFVYQVQKYLTLEYYVQNHPEIDNIIFEKPDLDLRYFAHSIGKQKGIRVQGNVALNCLWHRTRCLLVNFATFSYIFYQLLRIPQTEKRIEIFDEFTVLRKRSKQSIQRFKKFSNIHKEYEDVFSKDSIYRLYSRMERVRWIISAYFKSLKDFKTIKRFYTPLVGAGTVSLMYQWYAKRAVHTELFSELLDHYLCNFNNKTYYTGSNLDRYSVVEEKIAQKYGIKTICIPHGLEYGYKFPKGFSCEFCYTTGKEASTYLNSLYKTDKFKWDEEVARKMFKLDKSEPHPQMVVFFTEPREVYIHYHIIEELAPLLAGVGIKLYLKLHPADKRADYEGLKLDIITDYNMSLTNNICIARKSTTLLEAVYNDSKPIAIITNALDQNFFDTFPSLNTDSIIKTHSVSELFDVIKTCLGK